jgi:hypothetical protein
VVFGEKARVGLSHPMTSKLLSCRAWLYDDFGRLVETCAEFRHEIVPGKAILGIMKNLTVTAMFQNS